MSYTRRTVIAVIAIGNCNHIVLGFLSSCSVASIERHQSQTKLQELATHLSEYCKFPLTRSDYCLPTIESTSFSTVLSTASHAMNYESIRVFDFLLSAPALFVSPNKRSVNVFEYFLSWPPSRQLQEVVMEEMKKNGKDTSYLSGSSALVSRLDQMSYIVPLLIHLAFQEPHHPRSSIPPMLCSSICWRWHGR